MRYLCATFQRQVLKLSQWEMKTHFLVFVLTAIFFFGEPIKIICLFSFEEIATYE